MRQDFNAYPETWRLLGEIELRVDVDINDRIYTWLVETLRRLDLNDRFLSKILESAQVGALNDPTTTTEMAQRHRHLLIYIPVDNPSNSQSWGFFRVEKKGDLQSAEPNHDHAIVFYLYREGI